MRHPSVCVSRPLTEYEIVPTRQRDKGYSVPGYCSMQYCSLRIFTRGLREFPQCVDAEDRYAVDKLGPSTTQKQLHWHLMMFSLFLLWWFILRQTVSRPVRLGIGIPLLTRFHPYPLTRERVCNLPCH
jgi:hypothetical protein